MASYDFFWYVLGYCWVSIRHMLQKLLPSAALFSSLFMPVHTLLTGKSLDSRSDFCQSGAYKILTNESGYTALDKGGFHVPNRLVVHHRMLL